MTAVYHRLCPACGKASAPDVMRCVCGAMLFGVDLIRADLPAASGTRAPAAQAGETPAPPPGSAPPSTVTCPHEDCGQTNPATSSTCLYCNRPLAAGDALSIASETLVQLPASLRSRYRLVRAFPATGAEAEILLVAPVAGGSPCIVKLYRQGIQPEPEVLERLRKIPVTHRIELLETGNSSGRAYEVMEYCAPGSLREMLARGPVDRHGVETITRELTGALAAVHAAGLVHRDLKPANVLIRRQSPLDLVLTDFGVACALDSTQHFTSVARTLLYGAPECLSGVLDAKADYWSLGMLLLEAVLGRHPFAGLSEAVILHQLTTRSISLEGVRDPRLRKLLRGLLLRDPAHRWGESETVRWLSGDTTLADAVESGSIAHFANPYHLGPETCYTPGQLATALARHWREGMADLASGQLLSWFRDVQRDQNAVRLLLDLRQDRSLSADRRLLALMLYLAPGMPPTWQGESVELPAILARANLALKGDGDAARWLDTLHRQGVVEAYARAGHPGMAEVQRVWTEATAAVEASWQRLNGVTAGHAARGTGPAGDVPQDGVALYDDLVFGRAGAPASSLGAPRLSLLALHPRLLAARYDPAWLERLRLRVLAALTECAGRLGWVSDLGDPAAMVATDLLALEALLPELDRLARDNVRQRERQEQVRRDEADALRIEARVTCASLAALARDRELPTQRCERAREEVGRLLGILGRIRAEPTADPRWQDLRRSLLRQEPVLRRLENRLERLIELRAARRGWMNPDMLVTAAGGVGLVFVFLSRRLGVALALGAAAAAAWQFGMFATIERSIRDLARRL